MNEKTVEFRKIRDRMLSRCPYSFRFYKFFDYSLLRDIRYIKRAGQRKDRDTYNDCVIMLDTETSKETAETVCNL